jgi:hypothetical protein
MGKYTPNEHVINPKSLLQREEAGVTRFNTRLALKITNNVGTMWTAYIFALLSLFSLPAILVLVSPHLAHFFPHWIISASLISLIAWVSQNFLQLVLLPVIMVGQNVIQGQQDAKAETDHRTLTYLANLQEEQMKELKNQGDILEYLKKEIKR